MTFHSILALTDFSTSGEDALERAAQLAARHQAKLQILYADEVPSLRFSDPFALLRQRARQLARSHGIAAEALNHGGDMVDAIVRKAARADLLVMAPRQHRALHRFWRGTTLDQLMRRCPCPVLVVKQAPSSSYGSVLVAVDFTPESKKLVRYAMALDSESEVEIFHALESFNQAGVRSDGGSAPSLKAYRQSVLQDAQDRLIRFSDSFDTRRNRSSVVAGCFEPARQIAAHQDFARPNLLVVGKRRDAMLIDFLFGSIAKDLIPLAGCDVLVVSHDFRIPSGAAARYRMQTLLSPDDKCRQLQPAGRNAL